MFLKSVERGKCFIEYIPAQNAWCPINADGYMHINCFWVSVSFKGHGYANDLLSPCIADDETNGKDKREERLSAKERELGDIKDINTSYSYDNYRKRGEYMIRHT